MKNLIYTYSTSQLPAFVAARQLMAAIMTVSRLEYKPDLIKIKSLYPLPNCDVNYRLSFEETCLARADELWLQAIENNLSIMWSGGIDSTTAIVALLLTRPKQATISVYCNINSIKENPNFYKLILKEKFIILKNSSIFYPNQSFKVITGELGDQIFGSDLLYKISNLYGFENLKKSYELTIPNLFNQSCGEQYGKFLYDRYLPIIKEAPFKIETAFDFIWWWNFSQKWQPVKFRKNCLLNGNLELVHFFESENFQLWSIFNNEKKIAQNIQSYKMPAKEFIFKYDKNEQFKQFKRKYASPFGGKFYYFSLFDDGSKIFKLSENTQYIEANSLIV